ncbi:MAG: hypothetical protein IPP32_16585 [Bacteroidetes bacterium]|nr:hypothetical protein [Bacteroidota bacterium]
MKKKVAKQIYDYEGTEILNSALDELKINISALIAKTAIWVNPEVIKILKNEDFNKTALWVKKCRRKLNNETRRIFDQNGNYLDDNSIANKAIKIALGGSVAPKSFTVCHIVDRTAYNPEYYSSLANLVLIPAGLHAITDFHPEVKRVLQYHSHVLYKIKIGGSISKPSNYDSLKFNEPMPITEKIKKSIQKRKKSY